MRWAIVIGVDEYGDEKLRLTGAVADAQRFRGWVVSDAGGGVRENNLRHLVNPTKDEIITAISEVCRRGGGTGRSGCTSTSPATGSPRASPAATRARS